MTASHLAWLGALGGAVLLVSLAASAAGVLVILPSHGPGSLPAAGGWNQNGSQNRTTYTVTFTETALPSGTSWSVAVIRDGGLPYGPSGPSPPDRPNGGWNTSTGATIGFSLPNGTFEFTVAPARTNGTVYLPSPAVGSLTVNATSVAIGVTFGVASFFSVEFSESGLPNTTYWSVALHPSGGSSWAPQGPGPAYPRHGGMAWNSSTSSSVGFTLPDGNYSFAIAPAWTAAGVYVPSPSQGYVVVNGTAATVNVTFALPTYYAVNFQESGLPNGSYWFVGLAGGGWGTPGFNFSNSSSVGFLRGDGSFRYVIAPVWTGGQLYAASPGAGTVTVNGSSMNVSVSFALVPLYSITFVESGLPNGTAWSAGVLGTGWGNVSGNRSTTSTLTVTRPAGTYQFWVGLAWNSTGYFSATPGYGNVTVSGGTAYVNVSFNFTNYSGGWWGPSQLRPGARDVPSSPVYVRDD